MARVVHSKPRMATNAPGSSAASARRPSVRHPDSVIPATAPHVPGHDTAPASPASFWAVAWSVRAATSRPASRFMVNASSARPAPSESRVWLCRSDSTRNRRLSGGRSRDRRSAAAAAARGARSRAPAPPAAARNWRRPRVVRGPFRYGFRRLGELVRSARPRSPAHCEPVERRPRPCDAVLLAGRRSPGCRPLRSPASTTESAGGCPGRARDPPDVDACLEQPARCSLVPPRAFIHRTVAIEAVPFVSSVTRR